MLFPHAELSTRKQYTGEDILQILSSLCTMLHYMYELTNRKKQPQGFHQVNSTKTGQFDSVRWAD
jgi:hypothetical protein